MRIAVDEKAADVIDGAANGILKDDGVDEGAISVGFYSGIGSREKLQRGKT